MRSCCSTSTASRPTTTATATAPATCCCRQLGTALRGRRRRARQRLPHGRRRVLRARAAATRTGGRVLRALRRRAGHARSTGFSITAAHGAVLLPDEGRDGVGVLALADARMYGAEERGPAPAARQSADVLMAVSRARAGPRRARAPQCCELACAAAAELGRRAARELEAVRHAAALHDIGKMAIPESILEKPGPLTDERVGADPRAHHDRRADPRRRARAGAQRAARPLEPASGSTGRAIRTGWRAKRSRSARGSSSSPTRSTQWAPGSYGRTRSSEEALAELRRCAGTQFDRTVVAAFERVMPGLASTAGAVKLPASLPV